MSYFLLQKKLGLHRSFWILCFLIFFLFSLSNLSFAFGLVRHNGGIYFDLDNGKFISNRWVWLDNNGDGWHELYCFDTSGKLLISTVTPDGYYVNEYGALYQPQSGRVYVFKDDGLYLIPLSTSADSLASIPALPTQGSQLATQETKPVIIMQNSSSGSIDTSSIKETSSGVSSANTSSAYLKNNIVAKDSATEDVATAYIYGGSSWKNVMAINKDGGSITFNKPDAYNSISLSVAHTKNYSNSASYCIFNIYADDDLIGSYEDFNNSSPQQIEVSFSKSTQRIRFELEMASDEDEEEDDNIKTKTIYFKDARYRNIKGAFDE